MIQLPIPLIVIGMAAALGAFGIYTWGTVAQAQTTAQREQYISAEIISGLVPLVLIVVAGLIIFAWVWKR